ncbi:4800_t:CDS:2, partial [Racocetra persica]
MIRKSQLRECFGKARVTEAAEIKSDESGKLCLTDPVILKQESQVITASEAQEINSLGAKSQQQTEFVQKITKKHEKLYDDKLKFLYDLKQRNMWQDGLSAPQGYGTDEVLCDEAQTEENFLARRKLLLKFILNSQKTPTSI